MNNIRLDKKTVLLLGGLVLLCIFLLIVAFSLLYHSSPVNPPPQEEKQPNIIQSLFSSELSVDSISPDNTILLSSNTITPFTITFNKAVAHNDVTITLSKYVIATDTSSNIPVSLSQKSPTQFVATPSLPLQPYSAYTLTIYQNSRKKQILSQVYEVTEPVPTPLPTNNLQLKNFLPYETATYELSYMEAQNLYIFNFIYNPNDPTDVQTQFANAKQNALSFIKSKGIDPNSVTIDWRFH